MADASHFGIPAGGAHSVDAIGACEAPHDSAAAAKHHRPIAPIGVDSMEEGPV
jgi:hypothetical protein